MPTRKPTDYVQFKLRIRQSLLKQIQKEAAKKKHSANNEAVERLEQSFADEAKELRDSAILDAILRRERLLESRRLEQDEEPQSGEDK